MSEEYFFYKIIDIFPFLNLNMPLVELIFHLFIMFIGYTIHILLILSIFKLRKTYDIYKEPFYTIMIILSFVEIIGHLANYIIFICFRFLPLINYFLEHSPPAILFTIFFDIVECSFIAQESYYLLIGIIRYIAINFKIQSSYVS